MKHTLNFLTLLLALVLAVPAMAQTKRHKVKAPAASTVAAQADQQITLTQCVAAVYANVSGGLGNYYLIFSEKGGASFDMENGAIVTKDDNTLVIDAYALASSPIVMPEGVYSPAESSAVTDMSYTTDYSYSIVFDASGKEASSSLLKNGVQVSKAEDGAYTISATDKNNVTYTYTGKLNFTDPSANTHVFPQISADVNATCTGGLAYYHGNLYQSKTGNMYINLFDGDFDPETGGMTGLGYNLSLCVFNRLFPNSKNATVLPGTYTVARNFHSGTYYPGMEIDYMGMTMPFGSYVKQRKSLSGNDNDYAYAYIVDGTITIEEGSEAGKFNVTVDCVADDGHVVKATATNVAFPVTDLSDDKPAAVVSTLTEDVDLKLDYVQKARAYFRGEQNGCNVFRVDIGSPSGRDGSEGDILRMDFLADVTASDLPEGTYELMEENHLWDTYYAPFKLVQGYFEDAGDLSGTRYEHFAEGKLNVMDNYAAVISGRVGVEKVSGTDNYRFSIDVADGNGFFIKGEWTGPVEKNYTPTGIGEVSTSENDRLVVVSAADGQLTLQGVASTEGVNIYTADGRLALSSRGAKVNAVSLPQGVYIIKAEGKQPVKFIKK